MLDISIAVFLLAVMLLTAYLGIHVTLHPPETARKSFLYKVGFFLCGLVALLLIGWQTARNQTAQATVEKNIASISKAVALLGSKAPDQGGFFISEKQASDMIGLLWASQPHAVWVFHGCSFGTTSFFNQVKTLLTISRWSFISEVTVCPPDKNAAMTINGPAADDKMVLLLQRLFSISGMNLRYAGNSGTKEVALHLP